MYADEVEEQRALMQSSLRNCKKAVLVSMDEDGTLSHQYLNMTDLELLGTADALQIVTRRMVFDGQS